MTKRGWEYGGDSSETEELCEMDDGQRKRLQGERDIYLAIAAMPAKMADAVNDTLNPNNLGDALLDGLVQQHRTLQSEVVFGLLRALVQYGKLESRYIDPRNACAHEWCGKLRSVKDLAYVLNVEGERASRLRKE